MGPELTNGGMIAGAYCFGNTLQTNFFTTSPNSSLGQLQNYESVSKLNTSYNGRIEEGLYGWWCPEDLSENNFRPPDYWNNPTDPCPGMVISGIYSPNTTITAPRILRIEVVTVYEIQSNSTYFKSEVVAGGQDIIDDVNRSLASQPHFMPNASHTQWLKDFWNGTKKGLGIVAKGGKFLYNNRDTILPVVSGLL